MNKNKYALEITTVSKCSIGCKYCPQEKLAKNYPSKKLEKLSLSNFKKYLLKVPKSVEIHFSGFAEPFLNSECGAMIEHTLSSGYNVVIYTINIGMQIKDFQILKHKNIKEIVIHIPDKNYFKLLKNRLKEWITNIFLFLIENIDFKLLIVGKKKIPRKLRMIKHLKIIRQAIVSRAGNNLDLEIKNVGQISCLKKKHRQPVLMPNGDVYLCCNDYSLQHKLGNLKDISYMDLFKSDEYLKILKGFKDENIDTLCRKCEYSGVAH